MRARIVDMTGIDVGLYDFDRHNPIYFFLVSPDESIYLRYGGRDATAADSYLDLESFELALEIGLEQHALWRSGTLSKRPRPAPLFPRDIESLRKAEIETGHCVECHQIADYRVSELEAAGTLDKPRDMFRSPDIRDLGIHLDVPKGLVVERAGGAAAEAGLRAGDHIVALNGRQVLTFGDLQYAYDALDRSATTLTLAVERPERRDLELKLPPRWWVSDISYRYWSVDPVTYFDSQPLSNERKADLGLPEDGFACLVRAISPRARSLELHALEPGDVIYSIDGVETDPVADRCALYIQLHVHAGASVELGVVRNDQRMTMSLNTYRQSYRKTTR